MAANYAKPSTPMLAISEPRWIRPEPRQVKLNVDASFCSDVSVGATGAILRYCNGRFIAASCRFLLNVSSVAMAESVAMKEGLTLANRLGCSSIVAESDSIETVDACTGRNTWWNEWVAIFADIVDLGLNIGNVEFKHISREANNVAREIARVCFIDKNICI